VEVVFSLLMMLGLLVATVLLRRGLQRRPRAVPQLGRRSLEEWEPSWPAVDAGRPAAPVVPGRPSESPEPSGVQETRPTPPKEAFLQVDGAQLLRGLVWSQILGPPRGWMPWRPPRPRQP